MPPRLLRFLPLLLLAGLVRAEPPATAPIPPPERGLPLVRGFTPRDYHGHNQIWAITGTRGGLLLFANHNQVAEFDGQSWRTIELPGASYVRAMVSGPDGTVWVAGDNELGRLVPDALGRLAFESLRARVPAELGNLGPIWKIHVRPDGVYFQGNVALLRWNGAGFDTWRIDGRSVVGSFPYRGTLLVAREDGWFLARPGGQWERLGAAALGDWLPRFLLPLADGTWLVGHGRKGAFTLAEDGSTTARPTPIDRWLAMARPYHAEVLPDGRLLFLSIQGGALVTGPDLEPLVLLNDQTGLGTATAISGYGDGRGVLWIGTDRGPVRVELDSPVTSFDQRHGLNEGTIERIERVGENLVVSGTQSLLELRPPASVLEPARFAPIDTERERFTTTCQLPDGLLAGGLTGLVWISGGKSEIIAGVSGVREIATVPGQPGRFLATHINGICSWRRAGAGWVFEGEWRDLTGELRGLVADEDGAFWTATPNDGVIRFVPAPGEPRPRSVERYGEADGLADVRHEVWINSAHGRPLFKTRAGLFRFDPRTRRFARDAALGPPPAPGTVIRLTAADDRGGLWLAVETPDRQPREVAYARDGAQEVLPLTNLSSLGSLQFIEHERRGAQEILWVGGEYGIRQVDLHRMRTTRPTGPGASVLRGVTAGGRELVLQPGVEPAIPADANTVRFTFATPGLAGETFVRHETRLHGFRDGQVELAATTSRTFTNLPAGRYTFEVRGQTEDGRQSGPVTFAFTVLAPWWLTGWAGAGYALGAGGLLFVYIRWRIRRLLRDKARLEAVVAQRTAELAAKNAELQHLRRLDQDEKLAAQLAEEKARLELLRYQLNPHFLYNSLNSIRALVYSNPDAAGEMVTRLSEFCRWTLTRPVDAVSTVGEELEMLGAYLDIERARWQDGLVAKVDVDPAARGEPMPQFLLLPLLENAIKYGGKTSPEVLGIEVSVRLEGDEIVCEVANTGHWVDLNGETSRESTRIGLDNLRQRLARHYGPGRDLTVLRPPGWVRVQLRLPRAAASAAPRTHAL